jgi:hypothetical protein
MSISPPAPPPVNPAEVIKLVAAVQTNAAATLAAAIITASGRAHSVSEAVKVLHDIQFSLWPLYGHGVYDNWKKQADLDKPHV